MRTSAALLAAALPLLALACVSSEVRLTTLRQAPKSDGCAVAVYPSAKPPYPCEVLADDRASCVLSRNHCIDRLRADACEVGADTVYGFDETKQSMQTTISATLARKTGAAAEGALAPLPQTPAFSR
jgi:hypothetical protein